MAPRPAARFGTDRHEVGPLANEVQVAAAWRKGDTILGLYEISGVVGRGGMATVYHVYHRGWNLDLAVKSPAPHVLTKSGGAELFERECQTWVQLPPHPHVVTCYYVRRLGGIPRVFAEYCGGGTLTEWIRNRRLYAGGSEKAMERMLRIALQAAWGLCHAHRHRLVHQDVKPPNILLTSEGMAKVTDFGLSRVLTGGPDTRSAKGTPKYNSPEQAAQERVTPATDVWSWAVSVLEMFVGDLTWMAGSHADEALAGYLKIGAEDACIPEMPAPVVELLQACLQRDPIGRPKDMCVAADKLQAVYTEIVGEEGPKRPKTAIMTAEQMNNRAVSLVDLGRREEAEKLWRKSLEGEDRHREATYNRAMTRWRWGDITDVGVLRELKGLCGAYPKSPLPPFLLAQAHLERGSAQKALAVLERLEGRSVRGHNVDDLLPRVRKLAHHARQERECWHPHIGSATAACLNWDGSMALTCGEMPDGAYALILFETATGDTRQEFYGHRGPITDVRLSADGLYALSASADGTARCWRSTTGDCQAVFRGHNGAVNTVALSGDRTRAVTGGEDGTVRLWDVSQQICLSVSHLHDGDVHAVDISQDGTRLLTAGADGVARLWNANTGERIRRLLGHKETITSACLAARGHLALTGALNGLIKVWDLALGQCTMTLRSHKDAVSSLALSNDARYALSSGAAGKVRLWELATGRCLFTFKGSPPVALSGDGRLAVCGQEDGAVAVWYIGCEEYHYEAPLMMCRTA